MQRRVIAFMRLILTSCLILLGLGSAASAQSVELLTEVQQLLGRMAQSLDEPADRETIAQLIQLLPEHGLLLEEKNRSTTAWVELLIDRDGVLQGIAINARRLLSSPPLIQRAVILHELAHLRWTAQTRRQVNDLLRLHEARRLEHGSAFHPAVASVFEQLIRILIDDELRAYARDLRYCFEVVESHGGLESYLKTVAPRDRVSLRAFYQLHVRPFVTVRGQINELKLRALIFQTFAHRYPAYYQAALLLEAARGHVVVEQDPHGRWRLTRLNDPGLALAWLHSSASK